MSTIWHLAIGIMLAFATYGIFGFGNDLWKGRPIGYPKSLAIFLWLTSVSLACSSLNEIIIAVR